MYLGKEKQKKIKYFIIILSLIGLKLIKSMINYILVSMINLYGRACVINYNALLISR